MSYPDAAVASEAPSLTPLPETISVVVPAFNEEPNVRVLYEKLVPILSACASTFELIFVDDGSTDRTLPIIQAMSEADPRVRFVSFSRNFGHEAASTAGLDIASGEVTILMDADLQHPPEVIPDMVARWREGYEIVYATRRLREDRGWLKRSTSSLFYRLFNQLSEVPLPADTGDFRLIDRKALLALRRCRETTRFVRGLSIWVGFRQCGVEYDQKERHGGITKYNYLRLSLLALDALCSFSIAPLRFCLALGMLGFLFGAGFSVQILFVWFVWGVPLPGYTFQTISILFIGSLNFILLGLIAEYVGKTYIETRNRPLYIVRAQSSALGDPEDK
jgi:glycosyltransferase involved in cell wall biosynthesis